MKYFCRPWLSSLFLCGLVCSAQPPAPVVSKVWVADKGDGTYQNPILFADYSDPDVTRVDNDYYLTSSSFNNAPGLPILHSRDLVNWELIGHVFAEQSPSGTFKQVQHGGGVWAPAIRYHAGEYFIYYPDPDQGIYVSKARNPAGPWRSPILIKEAKGWIDPCPLWDDDGQAYLINAVAASRAGIKSTLIISRMDPDGTRLLDGGSIVYDGHAEDPTIEGPKLYKHNGYYYIAAPAGGVKQGFQLVLRSRNLYGPYERKVTLAQGKTAVNGPHQGGWVDTPDGREWWFVHFRDHEAYGRIVYLEPMRWVDDWPEMGDLGEPVLRYRKPAVGRSYPVMTPPDSDEFNGNAIGPQWQWAANPQTGWAFPSGGLGFLRLYCAALPEGVKNFWDVPNLLLQKFPGPKFTATTKLTFTARATEEKVGLIVTGADYAYLSVKKRAEGLAISQTVCRHADKGEAEKETSPVPLKTDTFYLRVSVAEPGLCRFSYSTDGVAFTQLGEPFQAQPGRWIGSQMGIFAVRPAGSSLYEAGNADFDWFRVE